MNTLKNSTSLRKTSTKSSAKVSTFGNSNGLLQKTCNLCFMIFLAFLLLNVVAAQLSTALPSRSSITTTPPGPSWRICSRCGIYKKRYRCYEPVLIEMGEFEPHITLQELQRGVCRVASQNLVLEQIYKISRKSYAASSSPILG